MKFHGKGKILSEEGSQFEGYFSRGKIHGPGRIVYDGGDYFQGEFVKGFLGGSGEYSLAGDYYVGDFQNGIKEGKGVVKYKNGSSYSGSWHLNRYEGKGTFTRIGGKKFECFWVDGKCPTMNVFDPKEEVVIQVDVNEDGEAKVVEIFNPDDVDDSQGADFDIIDSVEDEGEDDV